VTLQIRANQPQSFRESAMQHSLFDITNYAVNTTDNKGALLVRDSAGHLAPASDHEVLVATRNTAEQTLQTRQALNKPKSVKDFFRLKLNSTLEYEVFGMVLLNAQFHLIEYQEPFRGTLTQASVYPREIVKIALQANAAAIIMAHNHPSGVAEPS